MNKKELKSLNADLIALLLSVRDQIENTLDELLGWTAPTASRVPD